MFALDTTDADYHTLDFGLQQVAEDTGGFFARTHQFATLHVNRVRGALAGHYLLSFERPEGDPGQHQIELELASGSAVRFEQLRGRLREIAERRLAGRGLRFESDGARTLLGDEAWLLLDRPLERDKFAPGPTAAELDGLLAALERV